MGREFVFILMFVLMLSLVAGAGYNVVVPAAGDDTTTGGPGGGGSITTTNASDNETVAEGTGDDDSDSGTGIGDAIDEGVEKIKDFVEKVGLKEILILISGLVVIGASVWYFLRDRRKGYVEVKVKKKK